MIIDTKTAARCKNRSYIQTHLIFNKARTWFEAYDAEFHWLDVCSGRGDALKEFMEMCNDDRDRIRYYAYDLNHDFLCDVRDLSNRLGIRTEVQTGGLENLKTIISHNYPDQTFNCLSVVNVLHELPLFLVPNLLLDLIQLCNENGTVFFFDIMNIPFNDPEYGAIPWTDKELTPLLDLLTSVFGLRRRINVFRYRPGEKSSAWYFDFRPGIFPCNPWQLLQNEDKRRSLSLGLANALVGAFEKRLDTLNSSIEHGSEDLRIAKRDRDDPDASITKIREEIESQLRDFWACYREVQALRGARTRDDT